MKRHQMIDGLPVFVLSSLLSQYRWNSHNPIRTTQIFFFYKIKILAWKQVKSRVSEFRVRIESFIVISMRSDFRCCGGSFPRFIRDNIRIFPQRTSERDRSSTPISISRSSSNTRLSLKIFDPTSVQRTVIQLYSPNLSREFVSNVDPNRLIRRDLSLPLYPGARRTGPRICAMLTRKRRYPNIEYMTR